MVATWLPGWLLPARRPLRACRVLSKKSRPCGALVPRGRLQSPRTQKLAKEAPPPIMHPEGQICRTRASQKERTHAKGALRTFVAHCVCPLSQLWALESPEGQTAEPGLAGTLKIFRPTVQHKQKPEGRIAESEHLRQPRRTKQSQNTPCALLSSSVFSFFEFRVLQSAPRHFCAILVFILFCVCPGGAALYGLYETR